MRWTTTVLRAVTDEAKALTTSTIRTDWTVPRRSQVTAWAAGGRGGSIIDRPVTMTTHERHRLWQADPGPGVARSARSHHQDPQARREADPRRVRQLRRGDGVAAGRQGGQRRGQPRLDGPQRRGERDAHGLGDGRGAWSPRQRSDAAGHRCADDGEDPRRG